MDLTLDQQIEKAHADAERVENDARQIEARIVAIGGVPPTRPYGRPVDPAAVRQNLTLTSLLQRKDPKLAAYLGIGSDHQRRREEEAAERAASIDRMRQATDSARAINADAAHRRYQQQLSGVDAWGRPRWAR